MRTVSPTASRRALLVGGFAVSLAGCDGVFGPSVVPTIALPGLPGLKHLNGWPVAGIAAGQFVGHVTLLNVWASWCPVCRGEHETLLKLSNEGRFPLVGLVYMDTAEKAAGYLRRAGNPYRALAVDWGEYARAVGQRGVPATYVVDRTGKVVAAARGGISDEYFRARLLPAAKTALLS